MRNEVIRRAALIEEDYGPDVDEALSRWEESGAVAGEAISAPWLSVAFLFGRRLRDRWRSI